MADLSPNELEIMRILWEHGSQKPAQIQDKLSEPVKNSALRWQLGELVARGYVTRSKVGKAFYYKAKAGQPKILKSLTRRMAEIFCGGSAAALVGQMVELEDLSEEDLKRLKEIAEKRISGGKNSKGGK